MDDRRTGLGAARSQCPPPVPPSTQPRAPCPTSQRARPARPRLPAGAPSPELQRASREAFGSPWARGRRRWVSAAPLLPACPSSFRLGSVSSQETLRSALTGVSHRPPFFSPGFSAPCARDPTAPAVRSHCPHAAGGASCPPRAPCAPPGFTYHCPGSLPAPSVRSPVSDTPSPPTPRSPHTHQPLALDAVCQGQGAGLQGDCTPRLSLPCPALPDLSVVGAPVGLALALA